MKKTKQAVTLTEARAQYPHRYTMEHVPSWALKPAPNGKFYAPQFRDDKEWFENTLFPPNHPAGAHIRDCYTTRQTWPLGQWLDAPYNKETGWIIPAASERDCCKKSYWACECGASPMNANQPDNPPTKCSNQYCNTQKFHYRTISVCCQRYGHHIGTTCPHCGQKG